VVGLVINQVKKGLTLGLELDPHAVALAIHRVGMIDCDPGQEWRLVVEDSIAGKWHGRRVLLGIRRLLSQGR
jgi:hypothetical protein